MTIDKESGITANIEFIGDQLHIEKKPVYQFIDDISDTDATGDGFADSWYTFYPDGKSSNMDSWTTGSAVHHRLTNPPQECNRVANTFFCEVNENIQGEFSFCDQYCSFADFSAELTDTFSDGWTLSVAGVLSIPAQDYESTPFFVGFSSAEISLTTPSGIKRDYTVRFTIMDVDETSSYTGFSMGLFTTNLAKVRTTYSFLIDILDAYENNYDSSYSHTEALDAARKAACEEVYSTTLSVKYYLYGASSTDTTKNIYLGSYGNGDTGDSICNSSGDYGSTVGLNSIWNSVGTYGSSVSSLSPWNNVAFDPPEVFSEKK
tara:strand:+ start:527 stop:1483 length:957 start_codon:yes stop_codon:yes gene_type:complete